ncbi:DNA/RNA non-specific endonuclease [Apilactobacillus xinyiensis]|uniref:DNA/RNA non-specific endonuclease n=1 Tax=Apilactobacillus xinyiensis TaxID=2841032 RepID=UPI00200EC55D|nr:DNA/RNA non-specific endonuclease [Apilactobacillus xinyiensis]MCL0318916.1 DNA/RNA non-specific endonuclease [Apilactobacillus xinyiensis]
MKKIKYILAILTVLIGIGVSNPLVQAETYVYTTQTGKHYFYNAHDRGLSHAKKVYHEPLSKAKARGLTLSATEQHTSKHKHRVVVRKMKVKRIKRIHAKTGNKKLLDNHQITLINHNHPNFKKTDLTLKHGAWAKYGHLDRLNRATAANAMLNKSLMPKAKREPLYVDPTAWHNKRANGGWLYNRSHLIGYQFTGQNNNLRNLITGTRALNDPGMSSYENQVAAYLRMNKHHYVRYAVIPHFKGNNLLASGVQMMAQSIGNNDVHFNIYIKNEEPGFILNYKDGTSRVG